MLVREGLAVAVEEEVEVEGATLPRMPRRQLVAVVARIRMRAQQGQRAGLCLLRERQPTGRHQRRHRATLRQRRLRTSSHKVLVAEERSTLEEEDASTSRGIRKAINGSSDREAAEAAVLAPVEEERHSSRMGSILSRTASRSRAATILSRIIRARLLMDSSKDMVKVVEEEAGGAAGSSSSATIQRILRHRRQLVAVLRREEEEEEEELRLGRQLARVGMVQQEGKTNSLGSRRCSSEASVGGRARRALCVFSKDGPED
jgi:uncharacterized protein (DUF697 family)